MGTVVGKPVDHNNTDRVIIQTVQLIIYSFALCLLTAEILFLIGKTVSWYLLPFSFMLAVVITYAVWSRNTGDINMAVSICTAIVLFLVTAFIAGVFYDFSWDGNAYHKLSVGLLRYNWNPIKEMPSLAAIEGSGEEISLDSLWCETYCKVTWVFGAAVYALTGSIEKGKCYTMLGMVALILLAFYFFKKKDVASYKALILSVCIGINPIAIHQIYSFYIDGFLHTMIFFLVISLFMLEDKESFDEKISASLVASAMIVCGNIKFTGLLYGGLFCILFYIWDCLRLYKERDGWIRHALTEGVAYLVLAAVTVGWAGYSPYITNTIRHGSPTYPLTGEGKIDIMTYNSPFPTAERFGNLFRSLFSKMDNFVFTTEKTPVLKLPFTVDWEYEKTANYIVDARISGFGVLFSGILIIALITLIISAFTRRGDNGYKLILANIVLCVALTFGISESWWARYAPYIYMLVMIALYFLLSSKKRRAQVTGLVLALLILINNCLPLANTKYAYDISRNAESAIAELKAQGVVEVSNMLYEGTYFNLRDKNVYFYINDELEEQEDVNILPYKELRWISISLDRIE